MALFEDKVAKHGFVAAWILGGIARQIGFDTRHGALTAKNLFSTWMKQKWQRIPAPIRRDLFHLGISARSAWRGTRHSGSTIARGARHGITEGRLRHQEWLELREMQREFPGRDHPHYAETRERIEADRRNRFFEQQRAAAEVRQATREKEKKEAAQAAPEPPITPSTPIQPTVSESVSVSNGQIPVHPGEPSVVGDWQVVYTAADGTTKVFLGRTKEHAEAEAAWWAWRKDRPGGFGGSIATELMPGVKPDLSATNGHVANPGGCPSCAHNH